MASPVCSHLDRISVTSLPASMAGWEESNRHARRHAGDAGHPIARSAGPGEDWSWCFLDEVAFHIAPGGEA